MLTGTAFRKVDKRRVSNVPDIVIAPEIRFFRLSSEKVDSDWELSSDIWSMACTVSLDNDLEVSTLKLA